MNQSIRLFFGALFLLFLNFDTSGQNSVARQWNEVLLEAIKNDYARPTVHARNLFHVSIAMYDAWAAYEEIAKPFLLGNTLDTFYSPFSGIDFQSLNHSTRQASKEAAISYAAYRLLQHRFQSSPGAAYSLPLMDTLMVQLGYNPNFREYVQPQMKVQAQWYTSDGIYELQQNYDNPSSRFFSGASDETHRKMVRQQYKEN